MPPAMPAPVRRARGRHARLRFRARFPAGGDRGPAGVRRRACAGDTAGRRPVRHGFRRPRPGGGAAPGGGGPYPAGGSGVRGGGADGGGTRAGVPAPADQAPTVAAEFLAQVVVSCPASTTRFSRLADALYRMGDHDAAGLIEAAKRYDDASRPLLRAQALEAAAAEFAQAGQRTQASAAFAGAVEIYTALGATADLARLRATPR